MRRLALLAQPPAIGKAKPRLSPALPPAAAAALAGGMLEDAVDAMSAAAAPDERFLSWVGSDGTLLDSELGERIGHSLQVGAERGRELASTAAEKSAPLVETARKRGGELASTAAERSAPLVEAARKRTRKRSAQLAETVRERGSELAEVRVGPHLQPLCNERQKG